MLVYLFSTVGLSPERSFSSSLYWLFIPDTEVSRPPHTADVSTLTATVAKHTDLSGAVTVTVTDPSEHGRVRPSTVCCVTPVTVTVPDDDTVAVQWVAVRTE